MPSNLEVKARIQSIDRIISIARSIGALEGGELHQVDTYFVVTHGRLKLREINNRQAELISYQRNEENAHRRSNFEIYPCPDPQHLKKLLDQSIGIKAIVAKHRIVYFHDSTRIHIDSVENLGSFLEFEVPIMSSEFEAKSKMDYLVSKFEIEPDDYILHSYLDLIVLKNDGIKAVF